jgi:hypothetical protein
MADPTRTQLWNLLGQYMGAAGEAGAQISRRNLELWTDVSESLRQGDYELEQAKADAVRVARTVAANSADLWRLATSSPGRERMAAPLPLIFLLFTPKDPDGAPPDGPWECVPPDGAWVRLPRDVPAGPPEARVEIDSGPDPDAIARMAATLTVEPQPGFGYYVGTRDAGALTPGAYAGGVYAADTGRPLAQLRVEVRRV